MEEVKKYSSEDVFNSWIGYLNSEANDTRYVHRERPELLDMLVGQLFGNKIPHDEAKGFRSRVVLALTTVEGRKGTGKYRGWKETVAEQYDGAVANFYVELAEIGEVEDNRMRSTSAKQNEPKYEKYRYHEENSLIVAWVKNKFKETVTKSLIKEAHLVFGALNIQFQEEVYEAEWATDESKWPNWAKKACNKI